MEEDSISNNKRLIGEAKWIFNEIAKIDKKIESEFTPKGKWTISKAKEIILGILKYYDYKIKIVWENEDK